MKEQVRKFKDEERYRENKRLLDMEIERLRREEEELN